MPCPRPSRPFFLSFRTFRFDNKSYTIKTSGRMKHTYLTIPVLLAAAALSAQSAGNSAAGTPNPSGLVYERIGVGYVQNDAYDGIHLSGSAILGDALLVGGSYSDIEGRKLFSGVSGDYSRFQLGYVFYVGTGDVIVTAGYGQGNMYNDLAVVVQDEFAFGIAYRQAIGAGFEFTVGYTRVETTLAGLYDDGTLFGADASDENANVFILGLRYNLSREFDVTANYSFQDEDVGGDLLSVSAGYNF